MTAEKVFHCYVCKGDLPVSELEITQGPYTICRACTAKGRFRLMDGCLLIDDVGDYVQHAGSVYFLPLQDAPALVGPERFRLLERFRKALRQRDDSGD